MDIALAIARAIDAINRIIGIVAIYLVLFVSLLSAVAAILRYSTETLPWLEEHTGLGIFAWLFNFYSGNSNLLAELQIFMFAGLVMLGGAWTLKVNEHVRVDLVYGWVSERTRTWIDLLGGIFFLLPMCILMIVFAWPWFMEAFVSNEGSINSGGLARWPLRLTVLVGFGLVALQGVSEIIKCIAALTTGYVREFAYEKPLQ